jgi:hypothetical protein
MVLFDNVVQHLFDKPLTVVRSDQPLTRTGPHFPELSGTSLPKIYPEAKRAAALDTYDAQLLYTLKKIDLHHKRISVVPFGSYLPGRTTSVS